MSRKAKFVEEEMEQKVLEYQRTKDQDLFNEIFLTCKGLMLRTMQIYGKSLDRSRYWDEIYQEASLASFKAIAKWNKDCNCTFKTFFISCIKYQILHYNRDFTSIVKLPVIMRNKGYTEFTISLDKEDAFKEDTTLGETLTDENAVLIEDEVVEKLFIEDLKSRFDKEEHRTVFELYYLENLTQSEIGRRMGTSQTQVNRWKLKVDSKLKYIYKKEALLNG